MTIPRLASALVLIAMLAAPRAVRADLVVSAMHTPVVIDFENTVSEVNNGAYQGTGFRKAPNDGQLDTDSWAITGNGLTFPAMNFGVNNQESANYARGFSPGHVAANGTPGLFSFDVDNAAGVNRTFGIQPDANAFGPNGGTVTLRVKNSTGGTVSLWNFAYSGFQFNDQNSATDADFSYSLNNSTYFGVSALNYASAGTATGASWSSATNLSVYVPVTVADGGNLFLRWSISTVGSAGYDEIALDNILVSAVPEANAALACGVVCGVAGVGYQVRRRAERWGRGGGAGR